MKIWAKTVLDDKITRNMLIDAGNSADLYKSVVELCEKFDIPTPIVLKTAVWYFEEFGHVKFRPHDFVETVDFDFLEVERVND
jgi:hypothetical protein